MSEYRGEGRPKESLKKTGFVFCETSSLTLDSAGSMQRKYGHVLVMGFTAGRPEICRLAYWLF